MDTGSEANVKNNSLYVFPAVTAEKERLLKQYAMKKSIYGWTKAVPGIIELSSVRNILDMGAGTCVWSLDLASIPEIRNRRNEVEIYACDIDAAFFPPTTVTAEMGITTFEHDVTKPFPTEYLGLFDLVHVSFLFLCLTKDGWNAALNNVQQLLSPGGVVMIDEIDPVLFKDGEYERPTIGYDLDKHMAGESWVHKLNCLYTGFIVRNNFLVGLTFYLPEMLEHAGLVVVHSDIRKGGIGKALRHLKGANGCSLASYEESSLQNLEIMINQFVTIMRKTGTLEVPPGTRIVEEEKLQSILAEVNEGLQTEGVIFGGGCFVAKKI